MMKRDKKRKTGRNTPKSDPRPRKSPSKSDARDEKTIREVKEWSRARDIAQAENNRAQAERDAESDRLKKHYGKATPKYPFDRKSK